MNTALRRLRAALVTRPVAPGGKRIARELLWGLPAIAVLAFATGLARFDPMPFEPRWSAIFLDPRFLVVVAVLVRVYRASGSIWPCVLIHWSVVAAWKLLFAGPIG